MQICKGKCSTFLPEIAICLNLQLVRDNQTNRGGRVGGGAHDQPRGQGKTRGQGGLFRHIELVQKQPYLCNSIFLLGTLVVPIRSDQDNKVETCLLKQPISLLSRPTKL